MNLHYFDAWTRVGARNTKHHAEQWSLAHLRAEMEHCAISEALVLNTQSLHYDARFGNHSLCQELAPHRHLHAMWNVLPASRGEFYKPEELIQEIRRSGVRAVAIHPATNVWDVNGKGGRELFAALTAEKVPVFISRAEFADFGFLRNLLERHAEIPFVLTNGTWREQRMIIDLLDDFPNFHFTLELYHVHYGVEELVREGFEDRLLYGSEAPLRSMGAQRMYLDYADISEAAAQKIAGGNLRRLLRIEDQPATVSAVGADALMADAMAGNSIPHIDMHMHILHEGVRGGGADFRMPDGGPKGVFHLLDRLGCRGGGFMSWNGTVSCDSAAGNICTQEALDVSPPGYWGLGTFDPVHYSVEEFHKNMLALYGFDPRFVGMKPYFYYGMDYDDPRYAPWWEYGNERGLYALMHRCRLDYSEIHVLAERYPNIRWMVAHSASDFKTADMGIECARQHSNVYLEITSTACYLGIIDYLVAGAGADRIIYGSDLPMRDPRQQFGWVIYSRLSVEDKVRLIRGNAFGVLAGCWEQMPDRCRPVV